ncbi:MAG TPA: hypothetical protein VFF40_04740 [Acidimicrobiia bacterium]|nr:hypothetical protein [Acidimicrobiia bacterium]
MTAMTRPAAVLVAGVPRSGTTWIGEALGRTEGASYVNEPDGDHDPFAFRARLGHAVTPELSPGDPAPLLERLWAGVFAGGRPARTLRDRVARGVYARVPVEARWAAWLGETPSVRLRLVARLAIPRVAADVGTDSRVVIAKSVRAELCLEWIAARFSPRVLVVERNPLNVLASWIELGYVRDPRESETYRSIAQRRWGVAAPAPDAPLLERQTFTFAVLASALREAAVAHPEWVLTRHDDLCVDAPVRLADLAASLGLDWGAPAADFVAASDAPGSGYRVRRATSEQPQRWRERLDRDQLATIRAGLGRFPTGLEADTHTPEDG